MKNRNHYWLYATITALTLSAGVTTYSTNVYATVSNNSQLALETQNSLGSIETNTDNVIHKTWGTCPWTYDPTNETLTIGDPNKTTQGVDLEGAESPFMLDADMSKCKIVNIIGKVKLPSNCSALFGIGSELPPSVGLDVFSKIQQINGLNNFDTSNVTNMSYMFDNCRSLTNLDLSSFNTENVKSMYQMFTGCESLKSLDLSRFDTSNVDEMYQMFGGDADLQQLKLSPNFKTSKVTNMYYMFGGNESLSSLNLSSFDTSKVTNMVSMFMGDVSLSTLNLSNFNTSNVKEMDAMFCEDAGLSELNLSNFDISKDTDDTWMFLGDKKLYELELGNKTKFSDNAGFPGNPNKFELGGQVFNNPGHVKGDIIPDSNPQRQTSGPGWMALGKNGTPTDPKGKLYQDAKDFVDNRTPENETYVWQQDVTPTTPVTPVTPSTSSSSSSSSSSATTSTSNTSSSTSSQSSSSSSSTKPTLPSYAVAKGTVVYAVNKVGLYKSTKFSSANRRTWYTKKPRTYRPMFVVTGYSRDSNGRLRYQVRDVNHTSKTDGKTGYITASQAYVRPVY